LENTENMDEYAVKKHEYKENNNRWIRTENKHDLKSTNIRVTVTTAGHGKVGAKITYSWVKRTSCKKRTMAMSFENKHDVKKNRHG
jgi:hypothetical protein